MSDKLIFPIGFDLESGVKQAEKEWKSTYGKQLQKAIENTPLKAKIELDTKGLDLGKLREYTQLTKEQTKAAQKHSQVARAESLARERERIEEERVATAKAKRLTAEERLAQAQMRTLSLTRRQNNEYSKQSSYLERLFKRMVAYASAQQVVQFARNIRDVTAEFELQRVALGSIIGDLSRANAMFDQIKLAAVKSPFQIKELVTYTKQLAAYKIETDELFETTQKLADISAGLGVGMERLVLAYGQIRATGYLRASEVRQLTEAGVPIVEELAKKMTELRQETVSAAEVMGMISERAISFGMVKDVFDDMTSAGGMFYKMQEKQAETLSGQWSNLKDSVAIMYDEIGNTKVVHNAMEGMISMLKSLADNWRIVGDVTGWSIGVGLAYSKLIKPLSDVIRKHYLNAKATDAEAMAAKHFTEVLKLQKEREAFIVANPDVAHTGSDFIDYLDKSIEKHRNLAKEQSNIATQAKKSAGSLKGFGKALKGIGNFIKSNIWGILLSALAAVVSYLISASQEAKRLQKELANIENEGQINADQQVRGFKRLAEAIRDNADGSREQAEALAEMKRAYGEMLPTQDEEIKALVRTEEGYQAVNQAIRDKIALQIQEQKLNTIGTDYAEKKNKWENRIKNKNYMSILSSQEWTLLFDAIEKQVEEGIISSTNDAIANADIIGNLAKEITGYEHIGLMVEIDYRPWRKLIEAAEQYNDNLEQVEAESNNIYEGWGKYTQSVLKFKDELKGIIVDPNEFKPYSFAWDEETTRQQAEKYMAFIEDIFNQEELALPENLDPAKKFDTMIDMLKQKMPTLTSQLEKVRSEYRNLFPDEVSKAIRADILSISKATGYSMDKAKFYLKENSTDVRDWAKNLSDKLENAKKKLHLLQVAWAESLKFGFANKMLEAQVKDAEQLVNFLTQLEAIWKVPTKSGGSKQKDPWIILMQNRMTYMQDFYKGVKDLSRFLTTEDALAQERSIMLNRGLSLGIDAKKLQGTQEELLQWYDNAIKEVQAKIQKRGGKQWRGLGVEAILSKDTKSRVLKEYQELLQWLFNQKTDFQTTELEKTLERKLRQVADEISKTNTAKNFFEDIIGLTGDKELAATLTVSVYGDANADYAKDIYEQMKQEATTLFEGIDISEAFNDELQKIDPNILQDKLPDVGDIEVSERAKEAYKFIMNLRNNEAKVIKELYQSYAKFLSYEERRKVIMEREAKLRKDINNSTLDEAERKKLIEASKKRESKEISAIDIEEFKASDDWLTTFENLENVSTPTIEKLIDQLKLFIETNKEAFSTEQMRTLMKEFNKFADEINKRKPLKAISTGFKDLIGASKDVREAEIAVGVLQKASGETYDKYIALLGKREEASKRAEEEGVPTDEYWTSADQDALVKLEDAWLELTNAESGYNDQLEEAQATRQVALANLKDAFSSLGNTVSNVQSIINNFIDILGLAEDSELAAYLQEMTKWLGVMATTLSTIAAITQILNASLGWVALIAVGVAALMAGISYIAGAPARRAQKQIEELDKEIEDLSYQLERLEKASEKAFGTDYIQNYQDRLDKLQAQLEAVQSQADLESGKGKKADDEKVDEYKKQAQEYSDAIQDMYGELSEHFLGTDLASAARDFASAWIEAYKEFGNTTDAIKDKFKDMIENMIAESLVGRVMVQALQPVFDMIDNMSPTDFYDPSFWSNLEKEMELATQNGVTGAETVMAMLEKMGISIRELGGDMTGISRDVANASEESILGLAAGINTQNFYISYVPLIYTEVQAIKTLMQGGTMAQGGVNMQDLITLQNQHLSHLPNIAANTSSILTECQSILATTQSVATNLERVIKPQGTSSSYTMNISMR